MKLSKARKEYYKSAYFDKNNCDSVRGFYKNPSQAKIQAENEILKRIKDNGGYGYKVIGGNCNSFTAMWRTDKILTVETYASTYYIEI